MNKLWIASLGLGIVLAGMGPARVAAQDPLPNNPVSFGQPLSNLVTQGLKDNDPGRRVKALYAIGRLGPQAQGAIQDMMKQLRDERDPSVRWAYAWALRQIGPAGPVPVSGP